MSEDSKAFERIMTIMDELREQCPWDRKQTMESLKHLSIEELYELIDAIDADDPQQIKEELGDLLLHIVFYTKIAREKSYFTMAEMIDALCEKLIERHPHIYGDVEVENEEDVKRNWEAIKMKNKKNKAASVLDGVPKALPALVKAQRMQEKASQVGFDWDHKDQVWEKVQEELGEFHDAYHVQGDVKEAEKEFGDLLFALVNYARYLDINPESALVMTNRKFMQRFKYIERESKKQGKLLNDMSLEEMDLLWDEAKKLEAKAD